MAQQKNGPIIGLAIFVVLSILFAVFWYMTWTDNQLKAVALVNAANKEQELNGTVKDQLAQITALKSLIGEAENAEVGVGDTTDETINGRVLKKLSELAGDGTPALPNLNSALEKTAAENDKNTYTAADRLRMINLKDTEYGQLGQSKDTVIAEHKAARDKAEAELVKQEALHSEEMAKLESEVKKLRAEKVEIESQLATYQAEKEREVQDLQSDIAQKREAIIALQKRLREKEDLTFDKPDGLITSVDHESNRCYINIGSVDGLQAGVTFSVYTQANSGVGKTSTGDIKGQIEVVDILGDHRAEARVTGQDPSRPIAADDPIYSPIFQSGQALEIAVAGRIAIDGLDRDQFHRLVSAAGGRIAVEVGDEGEFSDGKGQTLSSEDAPKRITSRTRYLIIGDIGDDADTNDPALIDIYKRIQTNTSTLKNAAENYGVYPVGLSTFLEHLGYKRRQIAWRPEAAGGFPSSLAHGSRSSSSGSSSGSRESSAAISGRFSSRKKPTSVSTGTTSSAFGN
ncbi:MAG: hypothetical protein KDA81_12010 [Planctomycetaceae bacterium]|nr:hypothetical protein [Planctomycetaceae bacterium]